MRKKDRFDDFSVTNPSTITFIWISTVEVVFIINTVFIDNSGFQYKELCINNIISSLETNFKSNLIWR